VCSLGHNLGFCVLYAQPTLNFVRPRTLDAANFAVSRKQSRTPLRELVSYPVVFNGPDPVITTYPDVNAEAAAVGHWISQAVTDGIKPAEIGIFVRTHTELDRARTAATAAHHEVLELSSVVRTPQSASQLE
jgi:hypothetical protein